MSAAKQYRTERELLEALVALGCKFRNCPIVDDDFTSLRDAFDHKLEQATTHIKKTKPLEIHNRAMMEDGCMGLQGVNVTIIKEQQ